MVDENLRPENNASSLELSYEQDTRFLPELDQPMPEPIDASPAADQAARKRGPDGRYLGAETTGEGPRAYQHSRTIARLAADLGYTQEEIDGTPPELLEDRVYHVNKRTFEMLAREKSQQTAIRETPAASQVIEPAVEAEIDLSHVDDSIVKYMRKQDQAIAELKGKLSTQEKTREAETRDDMLDRVFAKLGRPELFGEGGRKELHHSSDEMERRRAVVMAAASIQGGAEEARLQKAAERLFGKSRAAEPSDYDTPPTNGSNGVNRIANGLQRRREEWDDEGPLARPSHRKPAPLSPDTRAALAAQKYMKDNPEFLGGLLGDGEREP